MRAALLSLLLVACGGGPEAGAEPPPLLDGRGTYLLRYNPPRCLVGAAELHVELRTPEGWERVALEDADPEVANAGPLLERLRSEPDSKIEVEGVLSSRVRRWDGNHGARILVLEALRLSAPSAGARPLARAAPACGRRRPSPPAR